MTSTDTHLLSTNDKGYKCHNCGSNQISVVKKDVDPGLKCNACDFQFLASEADGAKKAGVIPDSSPETLAAAEKPEEIDNPYETPALVAPVLPSSKQKIPRTPKYVFLSKDRKEAEFCGQKDLRKVALKWEAAEVKFECYELTLKKSVVKLELE